MKRRKTALWLFFLSLLFIVISMESVTGTGILELKCDPFQTISPFLLFIQYHKEANEPI